MPTPKQDPEECSRGYLERVIEERDRIYIAEIAALRKLVEERFQASEKLNDARFTASKIAVDAALAAQEKAVNAAFLASEKAIVKAEIAQKDYNDRSNEFRGQLDDQAKTLMPRPETMTMFRAMDEKVAVLQALTMGKIDSVETERKHSVDAQTAILNDLRTQMAAGTGKSAGIGSSWGILLGAVALIATLISIGTFVYRSGGTPAPAVVYLPQPTK